MKKPLWTPSKERIDNANMTRFIEFVNERCGKNFIKYDELRRWSIAEIPVFWDAFWNFADIVASKPYDTVVDDLDKMPGAKWFVGAKLNFAENLLRYRDDHVALIFKSESRDSVKMTYRELYDNVARLARSLREIGVKPGDRVAGYMPNMPETVVAMLASTSIGATWSSCSPDFGIKGVLDRFGQIEPKVLFAADSYFYNNMKYDSLERIAEMVKEIRSIEKAIVIPYMDRRPDMGKIPRSVLYGDFIDKGSGIAIEFEQLPSDHPLYIMYSSGTTGLPKCMVQSAAGILVHHLKELKLHTDLKRDDVIFYFTTCGWMMWNWLVSSLALGATIVLYDGSPFYPDSGALWKMAEQERITVFGTSARYIDTLEKEKAKPGLRYDLGRLRTICSTGSPLSVEGFEYVYREIKSDVQLASIAGGTDLNGCFALGCPIEPVYPGELQCRGLGMNVHAFDEEGRSVVGQKAELVCTAPFPSMPLYFWNDPDSKKYQSAYFEHYPNVWRHGDFIEVTDTGGVIMHGRSDATLNPGGVRIGTAEIYRQVEGIEEIADSLVVGQDWKGDERVILFVKMKQGYRLTGELMRKIRLSILQNASSRHVPAKIIPVADIPYTINMKKVEMAVKNVIHDLPVKNRDSLVNPGALELYKDLPELKS